MNFVRPIIKKQELFGYTKSSQRRFQLKLKVSNMTKEQCDKLEKYISKACVEVQPVEDK